MTLIAGWIAMLGGVASGMVMGLRFHREDWLGGYGSFRRRLIRLGHISFLGLGILNILFALSVGHLELAPATLTLASRALLVGGLTMPLCCGLMAWRRGLHALFGIPVASLVLGVSLIVRGMLFR